MTRFHYIIVGLLVWWGLTYLGVNDKIIASTETLVNPVGSETYEVTSEFGMRSDPVTGEYKMHYGIDLANSYTDASGNGIPIYATATGKITISQKTDYGTGYGKYIKIKHSSGSIETLYAHLNTVLVDKDQTVTQGEIIGYMGTTGNSTGVHLHFEVLEDGKHQNPRNYIGFKP